MKTILSRQGELVKIKRDVRRAVFPHINGRGNRAAITQFTKRSRKNLLEKFAIIDPEKAKTALFVTLTYIENFQDHAKAYKHVDLFLKRIAYEHQNMFACWRKELQDRGAIHFHLMIWNVRFIDKRKIGQMWGEITGQWRETTLKDGTQATLPPFTRIERCQNRRKCWHYISKYISKDAPAPAPDSDPDELFEQEYPVTDLNHSTRHPDARTRSNGVEGGFNYGSNSEKKKFVGRWWGWFNRKNIPLAQEIIMDIESTWKEYQRFRWDLKMIMPHTSCIHLTHTVKMFWFDEELDVFIMMLQGIDGKMALGWERRIEY